MSIQRLPEGQQIAGRYEVVRFLGSGGMGEVYTVRRLALGDEVALKRILPAQDTPLNQGRFLAEAQATAHIRHPSVVQVLDYGHDDELGAFLVMELLEGETLAQRLAGGRLEVPRAIEVFAHVCGAIDAAHRRGIIHRDLKPANVMLAVTPDGDELVKVLDFGLAIDQRARRDLSSPGAPVGTAAYMSPEQVEGGTVTPASDIFSLGVMLYEMVTGELPFEGDTRLATMMALVGGRYPWPRERVPDLPAAIDDAIRAALDPEPLARPSSAEALARLAGAFAGAAPTRRARSRHDLRPTTPRAPDPTSDSSTHSVPAFGRFVGRQLELHCLRDEYARALEGRARLAIIVGDTGTGKSRLLDQVAGWAREQGAAVLGGRFYEYVASRRPPLQTFFDVLGADQRADDVRGQLAGDATRSGDRWRAFAAIADALVGRAAGRPLVLALDDLHWATELDLDLLDHLVRTLGARGTWIVAAARSGASAVLDRWRAHRSTDVVELAVGALGEPEVRAWLEGVFRGLSIASLDVRALCRTTGGNLYALTEIARQLASSGVIKPEGAGWKCGSLEKIALPESVAMITRERVRDLPDDERHLLEIAAVIGDEFRVRTLAAASGRPEPDVDALLDQICVRGLVVDEDVSPGNDLRFASTLVRQVLYDDMPTRQRRRVHVAVVDALRAIYGDDDDRWAHVFAYHHHAVGDWRAAVHEGVRAVGKALGEQDFGAARDAIGRALDAAARADADRIVIAEADRALLDLTAGILDVVRGAFGDAEQRLTRAADAGRALDQPAIEIDALRYLALATLGRGEHEGASEIGQRAAALADRAGDRVRALEARAVVASAATRGNSPAQTTLVESLVDDLTPDDPPALRARILRVRSWSRMKRGQWALAQEDAEEALLLSRAAADLETEQQVVALAAAIRNESGDYAGGLELERQALALAQRLGDRRREAIARANLAEALVNHARAAEGLELLQGALAIFVEIRDRACEGDCRVNVGRALLSLGRDGEAVAMLRRGISLCVATGRREYEGIGNLLLGEASLRVGGASEALTAFERAEQAFAAIDFHLRWRASLGAARAAALAGALDEALVHARDAGAQLTRQVAQLRAGQDASALERGRTELDALVRELASTSP